MGLSHYYEKRNFKKTPEPKGKISDKNTHLFVIQKHAASHLHYDFRIELKGVLKSWAVPKGPSLDPSVKRLAIHVEDHPIDYGSFEGIIPKGEYGGGTVLLWDTGTWESLDANPEAAYRKGHLRFILHAKKLQGRWDLIRYKNDDKAWFLIKYKDEYATTDSINITDLEPLSVLSDKSIEELAETFDSVWNSHKKETKNLTQILTKLKLPKKSLPNKIEAERACLVKEPPLGNEWLHEVKYDGYRILAIKKAGKVTLLSRNNKDWTKNFDVIAQSLTSLPPANFILDGEVVLLDEEAHSNFQLLQNAMSESHGEDFLYYVFDILYIDKWDIRSLPLIERKQYLHAILQRAGNAIRFSDHIIGQGQMVYEKACELDLEGIISKRINSVYTGKRTKSWLKTKCHKSQEFVIGGFTAPKGSRSYFGALLIGYYNENKELLYAGKVGTGFTEKSLEMLHRLLEATKRDKPAFHNPPRGRDITWVNPDIVAEIEFTEWTHDKHLRHPSFKGIREDKNSTKIIRERPVESPSFKLTHPTKVLYNEDGITKQDLFNYYERVAPRMLPYILKRFLTLVRCPENYKDCFYQKKIETPLLGLKTAWVSHHKDTERDPYIYIEDKTGLLSLIQMGALEIHPWGSRIETMEYPDVLIFDLDPAPDVTWRKVVAAAFDIKKYLEQLELIAFVKTTGGKGLHIVIPIKSEYTWEEIKEFSEAFVTSIVSISPDKYIANMSKAKRVGKIFIDYLRNQRGATAIAPYSTRARLHAPISTPLHWDELSKHLRDNTYCLKNIMDRLDALKEDPWQNFWTVNQSLQLDAFK